MIHAIDCDVCRDMRHKYSELGWQMISDFGIGQKVKHFAFLVFV
jgi:hypothetical protein